MAQRRVGVTAEARGLLLELSETLQEKASEIKNLAGEVPPPEKNRACESPQGMRFTFYYTRKYSVTLQTCLKEHGSLERQRDIPTRCWLTTRNTFL